jgi:hypothetical protein
MITSELRFIVKDATSVSNGSFNNYATRWSGNTNVQSEKVYPDLKGGGTFSTIPQPSGWTFNNERFLQSQLGSEEPFFQEMDNIKQGRTYKIQFEIKGIEDSDTGYMTPYLYGISGDTVYADGSYEQHITIPTLSISGLTGVTMGQTGVSYSIEPDIIGVYTWVVPSGATIVSGSGTSTIVVDYGNFVCGTIYAFVGAFTVSQVLSLISVDGGLYSSTYVYAIDGGLASTTDFECILDGGVEPSV